MARARDVAEYILRLAYAEDEPELVSHLKLQKLVYYAQGFHLAIYNQPLFSEQIEAWPHGPVCPELYHVYKRYDADPIEPDLDYEPNLSPEEEELIAEVYQVYGQYSAWRLREMTHEEPPWRKTPQEEIISHKAMAEFFKTQLING